ncbi:MAG TPA: hypothetical protein VJN29_00770 [Intrasporangium sp.]|nr:hypothetical protein [Intrasporangium sp.]
MGDSETRVSARAGVPTPGDAHSPREVTMAVRTRSRTSLTTIVLVVWLLIGVAAAFQRGYFGSSEPSCSRVGSAALTIIAGPLNYLGLDPEIGCSVPQPSD